MCVIHVYTYVCRHKVNMLSNVWSWLVYFSKQLMYRGPQKLQLMFGVDMYQSSSFENIISAPWTASDLQLHFQLIYRSYKSNAASLAGCEILMVKKKKNAPSLPKVHLIKVEACVRSSNTYPHTSKPSQKRINYQHAHLRMF